MGNCCKKRNPYSRLDSQISIVSTDNSKVIFIPIQRTEKEKKERMNKKNEIIERHKQLRKEKQKEIEDKEKYKKEKDKENNKKDKIQTKDKENVKELLQDMCVLGSIMKEEIIEEKQSNPEKYISIEEATKEENEDSGIFCLGILAQNLEDIGIMTAIEKNSSEDEDSQNTADTVLEFITSGMIEKKKYSLHFDFGDERNEELLNDKNEQEKFNNKLRKKLSLEYNIPEEKVIVTNPQKGSYQVQVIFQTDTFNDDDVNLSELKKKYSDDDETFKELKYLKDIQQSVILEGVKLSKGMLDERGNRESGWGEGEKRGGFDYIPPIGWKGFGLKVVDKYDDGNNDWLDYDGNENEWAIAYHGIGRWSNDVEGITRKIIYGGEKPEKINFLPGENQAYENDDDARHPGNKVGIGVYCSPNPNVMEEYAGESTTKINGKNFKMGFMMRVKPDKIRYSENEPDYWVLNGTTDEMRPYRIMLKEY